MNYQVGVVFLIKFSLRVDQLKFGGWPLILNTEVTKIWRLHFLGLLVANCIVNLKSNKLCNDGGI